MTKVNHVEYTHMFCIYDQIANLLPNEFNEELMMMSHFLDAHQNTILFQSEDAGKVT